MKSTFIQIPCRLFPIEIETNTSDGLGRFDGLLLRAIEAGATTLETLEDVFALPTKLLLDATVALVDRGYVKIGNEGDLVVDQQVRELMETNKEDGAWLEELNPVKRGQDDQRHVVQDLVSGAVIPYTRDMREEVPGSTVRVPGNGSIIPVEEIPKVQLWDAARFFVRRKPERVLVGVRPARLDGPPGEAAVDANRFDLPVEIQLREPGDYENGMAPRLDVIGPIKIARHVRRRLADAIAERWGDEDVREYNEQFINLLDSLEPVRRDEEDDSTVADLEPVLWKASDALEALPDDPDDARDVHDDLVALDESLVEMFEEHSAHEVRECSVTFEKHEIYELPIRALKEADTQVVLVNPWLRRLNDSGFLAEVASAIERGIYVHILWGISRGSELSEMLEEDTHDELLELVSNREGRGRLFLSPTLPSRVHGKLVLCDGRWGAVSSANFLNGVTSSRQELAVRLWSAEDYMSRPIAELLEWVRRRLADYKHQRVLLCDPMNFNLSIRTPEAELPIAPTKPPETTNKKSSGRGDSLGTLGDLLADKDGLLHDKWREAWQDRWNAVQTHTEASGPTCLVVDDSSAHVEWLFHAIRTSKERLLIASHRISGFLLTDRFLETFTEAIDRGVELIVVHEREDRVDPTLDKGLDRLEDIGVRVVDMASHVKALVFDNRTVISSFNFLSRRRGGPHELGLFVRNEDVADQIWRWAEGNLNDH